MQRINLNIPETARRDLKQLARKLGKTESEVARRLLLDALERQQREDFHQRVAAAQTPELRQRLLEIAAAFEKARG